MKHVTDLQAWQTGMELVKEIYFLTSTFPNTELYGLTSQIRRASVSILANIAEGFGRYTFPDKAAKYTIARGECAETQALLFIAIGLSFITEMKARRALELVEREKRVLSGLMTACRNRVTR